MELLVAMLVGMLLLAGFTAFYLSEQRALQHHKIEVETSQELRTALEQMSRDLRSARKDLTRDPYNPSTYPGSNARILNATASAIEFQLDTNDDGVIDADAAGMNDPTTPTMWEHRGFRLPNGSTFLQQYDAGVASNNWEGPPLANFVKTLQFQYWKCGAVAPTPPPLTAADLDAIVRVDITVTMERPVVGGLPVIRTESESVRLRNVRCS